MRIQKDKNRIILKALIIALLFVFAIPQGALAASKKEKKRRSFFSRIWKKSTRNAKKYRKSSNTYFLNGSPKKDYVLNSGKDLKLRIGRSVRGVRSVTFLVMTGSDEDSIEGRYVDKRSPYIYKSSALNKVAPGKDKTILALIRDRRRKVIKRVKYTTDFVLLNDSDTDPIIEEGTPPAEGEKPPVEEDKEPPATTDEGPICGNNIKEGNEQCDSTDGVGTHQTCLSCQIVNLSYCGDGTTQNPNDDGVAENCDGETNVSCTQAGYSGTKDCNTSCSWDSCLTGNCGDGIVNGSESCDGTSGVGNHQKCDTNCDLVDLTYCGDGILQRPNDEGITESCDGNAGVGAHQSCDSSCHLINLPYCGDGIKNNSEACDGTDGIGLNQSCDANCNLINLPYCGDSVKNGTEHCDGTDGLGPHQSCDTNCNLVDLPYCGDGIKNGSEKCDGSDGVAANQSCDANCQLINLPYCGDGVKNGSDECDGTDGLGAHQFCDSACNIINLSYCGDSIHQSINDEGISEECDGADNVGANQSCSASCTLIDLIHCGDGIKNGSESCDGTDGVGAHQYCDSLCNIINLSYCGDTVHQPINDEGIQEDCDGEANVACTDLGYAGTKNCNTSCHWDPCVTTEYCGDNIVQATANEVCEGDTQGCLDANGYPGSHSCKSDCSGYSVCVSSLGSNDGICTTPPENSITHPGDCPNVCGDETLEPGEDCDDGNALNGDGCSDTCLVEFCGDQTCNNGEDCSSCSGDCGVCPPACGDGTCDANETCSSCSSDCGVCPPTCGDGTCDASETCNSCSSDCGSCSVCGNGIVETGETCDDSNTADGDGCSAQCALESNGQINLGDLNVPANRIPVWYPFDETVYNQAKSWPEYDATCANAPCPTGKLGFKDAPGNPMNSCSAANPADNGLTDYAAIDCMVDSAPNNSVIFLPNGTYLMGTSVGNIITIDRSNIVLRGENNTHTIIHPNKKSTSSITNGFAQCSGDGFSNNENCAAMAVSMGNNYSGQSRSWTAGFDEGETVITLAHTSGLSVGGWVMLEIPDAKNTCNILLPEEPNSLKNLDHALGHIAKITDISGNIITIDHGLRMDYDTPDPGCEVGATAKPYNPVRAIGIENIKFITPSSIVQDDINGLAFIAFGAGTVESWAVGNHLERAESDMISIISAARIWIQGNTLKNYGKIDDTFHTAGINVKRGAVDAVIENNYFTDFVMGVNQNQGPEGTVIGYNYMRHGNPPNGSGRPDLYSIIAHGLYTREFLAEGNDTNSRISTADHWWGSNGPRNTAYRNRVIGSGKRSSMINNRDKAGSWIIADRVNWIANTAWLYYLEPIGNAYPNGMGPAHDIDGANITNSARLTNMHIEKNVFRDTSTCMGDPTPNRCGFHLDSPQPDTSCGTPAGPGDCSGGTGDNYGGNSGDPAWASQTFPTSFYHSSAPSWWCQEACPWSQDGIGAFGDDFNGTLCKLPAQIRAEGGTCTPVGNNNQPPPVCGNGVLESGEQCDNGNTANSDGCDSQCQNEPPPLFCNDGICNNGETCSTCSNDCGICPPSCNGVLEAGEICDGNSQGCSDVLGYLGTKDCLSDCSGFSACNTTEFCPDTILQTHANEVCDSTTQPCTTPLGYAGTQDCKIDCSGYESQCNTSLFCGDGICTAGAEDSSCSDCSGGSLPNGLMAYWSFDNGNANDDSGNGNHGSLFGNTTPTAGIIGQAMSFDGNGDYIEGSGLSNFSGNNHSISLWIKFNNFNSSPGAVVLSMDSGNNSFWQLYSETRAFANAGGSMSAFNNLPNVNFADNTWRHVVFVANGSTHEIYINGSLADQASWSGNIPSSSKTFRVGSYLVKPGFDVDGVMDDVRIYDHALSIGEIQSLLSVVNANTVCGNGILELGEACDDGNLANGDGCSVQCVNEFCGDSIVQSGLGETCDDGNGQNNDGCSSVCQTEFCGDGICNFTDSCSICSQDCGICPPPSVCGNGVIETGETCDDGQNPPQDGDGCSSQCIIESTQIDLGDLNVPPSRIPQWYPFDETVYWDAQNNWPVYDVSCLEGSSCTPHPGTNKIPSSWGISSAVTPSNFSKMNGMINAAPNNIVLYIPAGFYQIGQSTVIKINRSNIVLRGAGSDQTIIETTSTKRSAVFVGSCDANTGAGVLTACKPSYKGSSVSWTNGYAKDNTVITLSNVSNFQKGGRVMLRMSGSTSCTHIDKPLNAGGSPDSFNHIAKIVKKGTSDGLGSNQIEIDRPLRLNYSASGCSGHEAFPYAPHVNIGIEDLQMRASQSLNIDDISNTIVWQGIADSWITGSKISRSNGTWLRITYSSSLWIQGNDFKELDPTNSFLTGGIGLKQGAGDIVIENNTCTDTRVCADFMVGAEGNIVAYNHWRHGSAPGHEKAFFNHGHFTRATLIEGNDSDFAIMLADKWWGRNGPNHTAYRNRVVTSSCKKNIITINGDGGPAPYAAKDINIIGNTSGHYVTTAIAGSSSCNAPDGGSNDKLSYLGKDLWLENNIWHIIGGTFEVGGSNNVSCGTGPNDSCPGTNVNRANPDPSWANKIFPPSFYRTSIPSWWCQETVSQNGEVCEWYDVQNGIGAFGDDVNGTLCKLPAQVRKEGGVCTPVGASSN